MNIFFTSDSHFSHRNAIKYCNRPFKDVNEMNDAMIDRWNSVCDYESVVYLLGDFNLGNPADVGRIISRLKFSHMHFIKGNHDKSFCEWYRKNKPYNVTLYGSYLETRIDGIDFTLNHYAQRVWNKSHYGAYHLYGHSHGSLPDDPNSRSFDVGVDCHNFTPLSLQQVHDIMSKKKIINLSIITNENFNIIIVDFIRKYVTLCKNVNGRNIYIPLLK